MSDSISPESTAESTPESTVKAAADPAEGDVTPSSAAAPQGDRTVPASEVGRPRVLVLEQDVDGIPAGEEVLSLPEVSERLGIAITRVMDQLRAGQLAAVQVRGMRYVPRRFFTDAGEINRFVPGLLSLLHDGGYAPSEIFSYLFTEDDSLPGRPVDALHGHLAREVMRRAQAMAIA